MKRMLLVSMFQNVGDILKTIEPNLKNKTVTFIPTASLAEKLGFFVKIGKWRLKRMGLKVEELEIYTSANPPARSQWLLISATALKWTNRKKPLI